MSPTPRSIPSLAASILKATCAVGALSTGTLMAGVGPTALGPPTAIPASIGTELGAPAVTPRPQGGFWVGWDAIGLDADGRGVAMLPVTAGGGVLGDLFPLNSEQVGTQRQLSLATAGNMVVAAWAAPTTSLNSPTQTVGGIFLRRIGVDPAANAEVLVDRRYCIPEPHCTQLLDPHVAVAENGTTSVYWDSYLSDNHSLRRSREVATLDPTYTLVGRFQIACGSYDPLGYFFGVPFGLTVANDGRASFARDDDPYCDPTIPNGIFLDVREADGSPAASKVKIDDGDGGDNVAMAQDPTGNLLVVWRRPNSGWFARHTSPSGEPLSAQFEVGPAAAFSAAVAADGPGTYVIVSGVEAPEGGYNLVGRRIGPEGPISKPFVINDVPLAAASSAIPAVTAHNGEVLVAWRAPVAGDAEEAIWVRGYSTTTCIPDDETLCLGDGRFALTGTWTDHSGNSGVAHAQPLVADTGTFWFFSPSNVELAVKVLDGTALNQHYWVFYGALSNVTYDLEVTDLVAGRERRYHNPRGVMASVGDTRSLPEATTHASLEADGGFPRGARSAGATAANGESTLTLRQGRFEVSVSWRDFSGGSGVGVPIELSDESGGFWFFDPGNVEMIVKVLDGAGVNGHFWVFYGALSNVEYDLLVVDTVTGARREYHNPSRHFGSFADTRAFATP